MKNSAGALRERVELLGLTETAGGWEYIKYAEVWAAVELTGKTNLFSKIGIGARAAELTLRRRALTLHQAARWRGRHLFLSEITEPARGWLSVQAAVVEVTPCRADPDEGGSAFPGVVTEKYLSHTQGAPMAYNVLRLVLVTPKAVRLRVGHLVELAGAPYEVKVPHELDPYKNEYEVERTVDA